MLQVFQSSLSSMNSRTAVFRNFGDTLGDFSEDFNQSEGLSDLGSYHLCFLYIYKEFLQF